MSYKTVPANLDIKNELVEISDEKDNSGNLIEASKLEKVIVGKIKEEIKNEFIVSPYKNVNASVFVDPVKPIEVIDIKIKEEIRDDLTTIAHNAVDVEGKVKVKIEVKKEEVDLNPNSGYIKCTPTYKKRKRSTEYECSLCCHRTFSGYSLARHKEKMHTKKEVKPYIKPPISSFQASFEEHIKQRKVPYGPKITEIFKCSLCKFQTESHHQFSKHSLQHNRTYNCTSCNSTSACCELTQHSPKHQNEESCTPNIKAEIIGTFRCSECSYETFNESSIKQHVTLHKNPEWAECPHCPYMTSYKHGLRFHSRLHEDGESPKDEEQESPDHENLDYTNKFHPVKTELELELEQKTTNGSKSRDLLRNLLLGQSKCLEGK